ncbi:hypothetical protein Sdagh_57510 [Streptomyces daghestanicus]|uniref:DUF397 domain-containing protein n=1 Tax=Streptomyces daghestanicus TaxID=66885 RepID=A0ABQ3Q9P9_9ACTN|nr:hypothetical protein GCM10010240_40880 [Streptomyces griseoviridis]GHI34021.1 hypothetical protein Sdagh_57510 [Streptomyces daghestanicus]
MRCTVLAPGDWRKSSYSGSGDGNACVEVAPLGLAIAVRDSKDPGRGHLALGEAAFGAFLAALKASRQG